MIDTSSFVIGAILGGALVPASKSVVGWFSIRKQELIESKKMKSVLNVQSAKVKMHLATKTVEKISILKQESTEGDYFANPEIIQSITQCCKAVLASESNGFDNLLLKTIRQFKFLGFKIYPRYEIHLKVHYGFGFAKTEEAPREVCPSDK